MATRESSGTARFSAMFENTQTFGQGIEIIVKGVLWLDGCKINHGKDLLMMP